MEAQIDVDEWYPVYTIEVGEDLREYCTNIEISASLYRRYQKALEAFDKVQDELEKLYKGEN